MNRIISPSSPRRHNPIIFRRKKEKSLLRQGEHLHILYEASQQLNRSLDLREIYQTICDFMSRVAPSDILAISAFDVTTKLITCRAYWIDNQWLDISSFPPIPLEEEGKGTQSLVIRSGKSMLINDFQARLKLTQTNYYVNGETNEVTEEADLQDDITRSAMIVALKDGDEVTGAIQIMSYRLNAYTNDQLKLLEALALHIVSAEKNARLYNLMQNELDEHRQMEVELFRSKQKLEATLSALPDLLFELDEHYRIVDYRAPNQSLLYSPPNEFIGKAFFDFLPLNATDVIRGALTKAALLGRHFGATYSLPMSDGTHWFELSISAKSNGEGRSPNFIVLAHDFTERHQAQILQEVIYKIAEAAKDTDSLHELYPLIHEQVGRVMYAGNFDIALLDEAANMLHFVYVVDDEGLDDEGVYPVGKGITSHVIRTGKSLLATPDNLPEGVEAITIGSQAAIWLGVPLVSHGKTIGAMIVQHYTDPQAYTEREHRMLEFVSAQVATAIDRKRAEEKQREQQRLLEYHYRLVEIMTSISTRFINLPADQINEEIGRALNQLGEFEGVDRSYIFQFDSDHVNMNNTHEWCAPDVEPQIKNLQNIPIALFPWWVKQMECGDAVYIPLVSQLPPEADLLRESLEMQGIQSLLSVPLVSNNKLFGFVGFDAVQQVRTWDEDSILLIKMLGDIISNALIRKSTEEDVKQIEQRNRALIENAPDGIVLLDTEGRFTFGSPSAAHIFGYEPYEIIGQPSGNFLHPDDQHILLEIRKSFAEAPSKVLSYTYRARHKNGTYKWVEAIYTNLLNQPGVNALVVNFRDITEQKAAAESLRQSESRFSTIFNNSPVGISITRMNDNTIIDVNRAWLSAWGYERGEVLGQRALDLGLWLHPDDRQHMMAELLASQKIHQFETIFRRKTGELRNVLLSVEIVMINDEQTLLIQVFDITERKQTEIALVASEQRLQSLVNSQTQFVLRTNLQGQIIYWNNKYLQEFGWIHPGELHETSPLDAICEYHHAIANATVEKCIHNPEQVFRVELDKPAQDGSTRTTLWEFVCLTDENHAPSEIQCIGIEITDRKKIEQALLESQEKYRGLLSSLDNIVASVDYDGRFLYANNLAAKQMGIPVEALIGRTMHDLFPEPLSTHQLENIRKVMHEDKPMINEASTLIRGEARWYRTTLQPVHDHLGKVAYVLINSTDIHDLKTAQAELELLNQSLEQRVQERTAEVRRSEATYRALFENSNDGIFLLAPSGEDLHANQKALNMLGYTLKEYKALTRNNVNAVADADQQADADARFAAALRGDYVPLYERTFIGKNNKKVDVEINLSPVRDPSGNVIMVQSVVRDITERKKAQEELRESRDKLSIANAALEKASRMKDEFLASMSHELRTPLTGILGLSEALQSKTYGELSEKQMKALSNIESSGRHLLELINDILDLSKIEAGKLEMQIEPCSVADICQASLQLMKGMAHQKRQNISFQINPASIIMRADPRRLKQMLVNLLSNAVKFTPNGGSLGLTVQENPIEKSISFTVWDKGIGIQPENISKLFKPFLQLDSSLARQYAGTGLGLSLVQRMAELQGGSVQVESAPGEGSQFIIVLPHESQMTQPIKYPRTGNTDRLRNALIIEDNTLDVEHASRHLRDFGVTPIVQPVLEGAFEKAASLRPSAILLDLQMPDGSGFDLLAKLKADERTRSIPIIICSVVEQRSEAQKMGASGYLLKPYTKQEIQIELQKASAFVQPGDHVMVIGTPSRPVTVVMADDNELILETIGDYLQAKGYNFTATRSGFELLGRAPEVQPDIMLVDIQMPGMDGMETIRRLRAHSNPHLASIPIIAVTALAMTGDREKCIEAGANEYLSKPISLEHLNKRIREILKKD